MEEPAVSICRVAESDASVFYLKMKAAASSKTVVCTYKATHRDIPEDCSHDLVTCCETVEQPLVCVLDPFLDSAVEILKRSGLSPMMWIVTEELLFHSH